MLAKRLLDHKIKQSIKQTKLFFNIIFHVQSLFFINKYKLPCTDNHLKNKSITVRVCFRFKLRKTLFLNSNSTNSLEGTTDSSIGLNSNPWFFPTNQKNVVAIPLSSGFNYCRDIWFYKSLYRRMLMTFSRKSRRSLKSLILQSPSINSRIGKRLISKLLLPSIPFKTLERMGMLLSLSRLPLLLIQNLTNLSKKSRS